MKSPKIILSFILIFSFHITSGFASQSLNAFLRKHARDTEIYRVEEIFTDNNASGALIILEDAHCNTSVQKQLIMLTQYFNFDMINSEIVATPLALQEGGSYGPIETNVLKKGKNTEELNKYLDAKLEAGEIGAAEYLHAKGGNFTFVGIEDDSLYESNYRHFMDIAEHHNSIQLLLDEIDSKLQELRSLILSSELASFYTAMQNNMQTKDIEGRLEYLRLLSLQYNIDLKNYKTLARYFETSQALGNLNAEEIDKEIARFNQTNNSSVSIDKVFDLYTAGIIKLKDYPELFKFGKLRESLISTKMISFIKEKESLEDELLTKLAYTDEEKELIQALRNFSIISKILSFTLNRDEYNYYAEELSQGRNLLRELIDYLQSYFPTLTVKLPLDELQKSAESFYHAVNKRDDAIVENIVKATNEFNSPLATLIIGGFHTGGITQRLKEKHISFLTVTPNLKELDEEGIDNYYDVMKRFWQGRVK